MAHSGWRVVLSWPADTPIHERGDTRAAAMTIRAARFTEQSHHDTLNDAWAAYHAGRRKLAGLGALAQLDLVDLRTSETIRTEWNAPE